MNPLLTRPVWSRWVYIDNERSLFFLGPSRIVEMTMRVTESARQKSVKPTHISFALAVRVVTPFSSRAVALVFRVSRLRRSPLPSVYTLLTKSEERERLLAVYAGYFTRSFDLDFLVHKNSKIVPDIQPS